ncbi:uncharacterized protein LOC111636008 isoform X2 [Centruroides sculpturatus]|uniref:uncharacterized protein LOC111636008 isoform X2 n=1 Tax=Centruroides sculpturatus TaxID=218467 RepID=UPI000C6E33D6|nr:uncharacterized protein LOC111636008 isoform X2 [Centruroides sculpturatus]
MYNYTEKRLGSLFYCFLTQKCHGEPDKSFKCPEQFGYFADMDDCSKYFVCVFGDALHESCTGGLYFSAELQTCDWPRNVECASGEKPPNPTEERPPQDGFDSNRHRSNITIISTPNDNQLSFHNRSRSTTNRPTTTTTTEPTTIAIYKSPHDYKKELEPENLNPYNRQSPDVNESYEPDTPDSDEAAPPYVDSEGGIYVNDGPPKTSGVIQRIPGVSDYDVFIKQILVKDESTNTNYRRDNTNKLNGYGKEIRDLPPLHSNNGKSYDHDADHNQTTILGGYDDNFEATRKTSIKQNNNQPRIYEPPPAQYDYPPDYSKKHLNSTRTPTIYPTNYDTSPVQDYPDYQSSDYDYPTKITNRGRIPTTTASPTVATTDKTTLNLRNTPPSRPKSVYSTPPPFAQAVRCDSYSCALPDCRCGGTDIPGGLTANQVPQIVLLTFDDAINDLNYDLYKSIFLTGRKNPNGCPILGTFYVSHEWTDYGQVQTLYSQGHEMASHSITHSYGEKFSKSQWYKEIQGQREILHKYGGVKLEDIRGMRAPFLQIGGNKMFDMLYEANFTYDASMPIFENSPPFWPYTLDYAINHECMIAPCPTKSYPGLWELGLVMWLDLRGGRCSMADACANPQDEEGVIKMLTKNFNRHYKNNKAPFGLFYHSAWFNTDHHRRGFLKFLDNILDKQDVWFVTNWQLVQWMRNPTPLDNLANFEPWQCDKSKYTGLPEPCPHPTVCSVWYQGGVRYMKTCQPCPTEYPWVSPEDKG